MIPSEVVDAVLERSGGKCEIQVGGCRTWGTQFHHRKLRSQGGEDTVENVCHACTKCHGWAHANPKVAYEHGYLVESWQDPAAVPIRKGAVLRG